MAVNLLSLKIIFKYSLLSVAGIMGLSYLRIFIAADNAELFYAIGATLFIIAGIYIGIKHNAGNILPAAVRPGIAPPPLNTILSRRELEVLDALRLNKPNPEIAQGLFISESTLKTHITRIYKKLGVKNRKELFAAISSRADFQSDK